jgi:hypothetical protein
MAMAGDLLQGNWQVKEGRPPPGKPTHHCSGVTLVGFNLRYSICYLWSLGKLFNISQSQFCVQCMSFLRCCLSPLSIATTEYVRLDNLQRIEVNFTHCSGGWKLF